MTEPASTQQSISRIAVGVDGHPEGRDAVVLGAKLAAVTGAELMLVAIHPRPLVPFPRSMSWATAEKGARAVLAEARDAHAEDARIVVETDASVPRALERVARREHRDLLVVGSSREGPQGKVRIGKRTRQLLCHFESTLAIAARGLHERPSAPLARIGVGYDGGPESHAALVLAGSIAVAARAELRVCAVVDDRLPAFVWSPASGAPVIPEWEQVMDLEAGSLLARVTEVAEATGASATTEVLRGRPADALLALASEVDLLAIGSRRWGPVARVLLGSTGEALMHDAPCSVLVVPRTAEER
jgi:nucleotide-binding universal stress UspA family protein